MSETAGRSYPSMGEAVAAAMDGNARRAQVSAYRACAGCDEPCGCPLTTTPAAPGAGDDGGLREALVGDLARHYPRHERYERSWGSGWRYVGCTCGWDSDGAPFAQHQADALLAGPLARLVADAARDRAAVKRVEELADWFDGGGAGVPRLRNRGATSNAYAAICIRRALGNGS